MWFPRVQETSKGSGSCAPKCNPSGLGMNCPWGKMEWNHITTCQLERKSCVLRTNLLFDIDIKWWKAQLNIDPTSAHPNASKYTKFGVWNPKILGYIINEENVVFFVPKFGYVLGGQMCMETNSLEVCISNLWHFVEASKIVLKSSLIFSVSYTNLIYLAHLYPNIWWIYTQYLGYIYPNIEPFIPQYLVHLYPNICGTHTPTVGQYILPWA